ncbi:metalloprotease [Paramyrothecium foliicola]|nr:metalloprotease [Paramyrothecium foliicola]
MLMTVWFAVILGGVDAMRRCGTTAPPIPEHHALTARQANLYGRENVTIEPIVIPTYFHLFAFNETIEGGWASDKDIQAQIEVMQADFAPHNISFDIRGINRTVHPVWASNDDPEGVRKASYIGSHDVLNIYLLADLGGGVFGYATFPGTFIPGSEYYHMDCVTVVTTSMPGGSYERFNLGKTATHEIGHWLGVYLTFAGGCSTEGDLIDDTPASFNETVGCPIGRDSCPGMPGLDPIHNYMDYSDDACMREFTKGQAQRMHAGWRERLGHAGKSNI